VAGGQVQVEVHQRFSLAQAADAHRALEARSTTGSTVLLP
ncbi:zinc-binding dehydrogenase, partial [Acinetobacter baumannii]|nr:zinc-binding dehydrogenase [Acinetobacter baumannii]